MKIMVLKTGVVGVAGALVVGMGESPARGQCVPPPSGIVRWWDADSVSGTTAFDIQDANDGTFVIEHCCKDWYMHPDLSF